MTKHQSIKCEINNCGKPSRSRTTPICEMHYYRYRRNKTYSRIRTAKKILNHSGGYILERKPNHPLSDSRGYVYQHRAIYFDVHGHEGIKCAICGKDESIETCHIDHIDEDKKNNDISNLRVTCMFCNMQRTPYRERKSARLLTAAGETKTITEWAEDGRVTVHKSTIDRRIRQGMSVFEALFTPSKTHHGN